MKILRFVSALRFVLGTALMMAVTGCVQTRETYYTPEDYYEKAKMYMTEGRYSRAADCLQYTLQPYKGTARGPEVLFLLAENYAAARKHEAAASCYERFISSYPRHELTATAAYLRARSLTMLVVPPELDQAPTHTALLALSEFLEKYPDASYEERSQVLNTIQKLQDQLCRKELLAAKLYLDLGEYIGNCSSSDGNNYTAAIITASQALTDYPHADPEIKEALLYTRAVAALELAKNSVAKKVRERTQQAQHYADAYLLTSTNTEHTDHVRSLLKGLGLLSEETGKKNS